MLEERPVELKLVNAQHVKILLGRKRNVLDVEWLAELLEHELLRGSFVPPPEIRELRDLNRYRKRLSQAHSAEGQRIAKFLEDAGIKLGSVAAEVLGVFGRVMLAALVVGEHHALLIGLCLTHLTHLEAAIAQLDQRIDAVFAEPGWLPADSVELLIATIRGLDITAVPETFPEPVRRS